MSAGDFPKFPDSEAVASGIIRAANITNLEDRVYSSIPKQPTYALATVQRVGGEPSVRQYLDSARIQISVYGGAIGDPPGGPSKSAIHDISATIRAVLMDLEGETVSDPVDAHILAVDDYLGLAWVPDNLSGRDRYTFGVTIHLRAA